MTQCWQHCPEHRPNFTTILERISYCTQDPDVINTPLPMEYGPPVEEESSTVMPPQGSGGGTPLLVTSTLTPEPDLSPRKPHPQGAGTGEGPSREACPGTWLHPSPAPLTPPGPTSSGSQKLKNKTKNLWNPTYGSWKENGSLVPLLIAAGGGGKAYLEDPERGLDDIPLEQYENSTAVPGVNGLTGVAGGGGGWSDITRYIWGGKSLLQGAEGGSSCPQALSKLAWATFGGFGGGGGACTAGGGGGGYRGGDAAETDDITADGQAGISFVNPIGEIFLQPLAGEETGGAAMESHGEAEIKVQLNCSHCESETCKQDEETKLITCLCDNGEELASNNVTCTAPRGPAPEGHLSLPLILAVVVSTVVTGAVLACASLTLSGRLEFLSVLACLSSSRFHLTLRAVWGPGSRADLSVDGITLGASCFDTGPGFASQQHSEPPWFSGPQRHLILPGMQWAKVNSPCAALLRSASLLHQTPYMHQDPSR
ncbi:ALK tyrosine kinase receptor [Acipenser ruthenus]|uniref:ALK tyrosine kinase receptor n=1 Tax=Acipenser ruthenus TaxID=7906 RepID=A0A444UY89_ACIRT|nr:ALK tyrosine kinase receptor [Acipenser ruthenus]